MKDTTNKFPSSNQIRFRGTVQYPDVAPITPPMSGPLTPSTGGQTWATMGTAVFPGGSVAFFKIKKFFDPLVDTAKEYLAKHAQPDNIVNPLQPDELKGEVVTVRSDN